MSDQTLSNNLGITIEEAQHLTDILFSNFNVVKKFIDKQAEYPLHHDGRINTFLGDDLYSPDWDKYLSGDKYARGRVMRHGVNLSIQGVSACYLAAGFYNVHRVARQKGLTIQPLIVVHDSATMYFKTSYLPFINQYYVKYFKDYLYEFCQTPYKFDTFIGSNYHDVALLENISYEEIKLSGTGVSICNIIDKLDESGIRYELSKSRADLEPKWEPNPIVRYMKSDYGSCMAYDTNYTDVNIKFLDVPYDEIDRLELPR